MNSNEEIPQEQPVEPEKPAQKKAQTGAGKRKTSGKKAVENEAVETETAANPASEPKIKTGRRGTRKESASASRKKSVAIKREKTPALEGEESLLSVSIDEERVESPLERNEEADIASKTWETISKDTVVQNDLTSKPEPDISSEVSPRPGRVSIFFDRILPVFAPVQSEKTADQERPKDENRDQTSPPGLGKKQKGKKGPSTTSVEAETQNEGLPEANAITGAPTVQEVERLSKKMRGSKGRSRLKKNSELSTLASESADSASVTESRSSEATIPLESNPLAEATTTPTSPASSDTKAIEVLGASPMNPTVLVSEVEKPCEPLKTKNTTSKDNGVAGTRDSESSLEADNADQNTSDSIIVEHSGQGEELPPVTMEELPQALQDAAARAGWYSLMPVQQNALPYGLAGRDLMVQSRTGSGKTGAFLLPLLARLEQTQAACQALVLVPTRELALQVEHEASVLFKGTGLVSAAVYGGVGYTKQIEQLRKGAHLVVGTPGRVLDHLLKRTLNLDSLRALVFDESDRMLSIGFYPDMKEIQRYLPKCRIPTQLFSATYPPHVLRLSGEFLRNPHMLSLSQNQVHAAQIDHISCECATMEKDRTLVRLIEIENPSSAIVFCNTKANVHYVTGVLQGFGYNADELSSDLSQARREEVLGRLRKGEIRFLVATDVAARGIDIPELSHVFLYEPPEDQESYIHRAGRTGRAGAAGTAISIVDVMERLELQRIAKHYKIEIRQRPVPTDDDVSSAVGMRMTTMLEARYRNLTGLQRERARRLLPLIRNMAADEELLNLLAMLLDNSYQEPAVLPGPGTNNTLSGRVMASRVTASGVRAESSSMNQKSNRRRRRRKPPKPAQVSE